MSVFSERFKDATGIYSEDHVHAALDVNIPNYASALVTANEMVSALWSRDRSAAAQR